MATPTEWKDLQEAEAVIPTFTMSTVINYFVTRVALDGKQAMDFKNLNSHAFPLFKCGHVQSIQIASNINRVYCRCRCLPEMKKNIVYRIEVVLKSSEGDIVEAKCDCPAGTGPHGSCKHIAAFCYALEEFCRIRSLRPPESCTSQPQSWNQPRKRRLDPCDVSEIQFVKHEYGKIKKPPRPLLYDPRPERLRCTTDEEVEILKQRLTDIDSSAALLHVLSTQTVQTPPTSLPPAPSVVKEEFIRELQAKPQPLALQDVITAGTSFLRTITYSPAVVRQIEMETQHQRLCKRWHEERNYRLTASKFGTVGKRRAPRPPLAKNILYAGTQPISAAALKWGCDHEKDAIETYRRRLPPELQLMPSGIVIDKSGFLAASPDGVVLNTAGEQVSLVEFKCPYSAKHCSVVDACSNSTFFCKLMDGKPVLKRTHNYYYQVQGQMAITGIKVCDFAVWTPTDMTVEEIYFDEYFWCTKVLPTLRSFYFEVMLPEIVYPRHPLAIMDYSNHMNHM